MEITSNKVQTTGDRYQRLTNELKANWPKISASVTKGILALEDIDGAGLDDLNKAAQSMGGTLQATMHEMTKTSLEGYQEAAGVYGAMLGQSWRDNLARTIDPYGSTTANSVAMSGMVLKGAMEGRLAAEAYDEVENKNSVYFSAIYNMMCTKQDEWGEAFSPTIAISPDNSGVSISVDLMMVFDDPTRDVTGVFTDWQKRNIIRGIADPTVLRNNETRAIPVVRTQNKAFFVDETLVAPFVTQRGAESITTAPLVVGKKIAVPNLCQTDAMLNAGPMNATDSLDPTVQVDAIYVKVGDDVLKFPIKDLALNNFVPSGQNNYRVQVLNFTTNSLLINKNTVNVDNSALTTLAAVKTNDVIVRVEAELSGSVNIETGEMVVYGNLFKASAASKADGTALALTDSSVADIVALLNAGTIFGYDPYAWLSNKNRLQLGQLIDVTKYAQQYMIPLRSPVTARHPINSNGEVDAADVKALITATNIRMRNDSVTNVIESMEAMEAYVDVRDGSGVGPDVLGVGRLLVRPAYRHDEIDMLSALDSLTSTARYEDMSSVLVNHIRDMVSRLYRDSEFQAANDAYHGGMAMEPEVVIGTDPVLATYLMVTGDLRTLGAKFKCRVVSTLDKRIKDKIYVAFSFYDQDRNTVVNPLTFSNLFWASEMVLSANLSRNGRTSRETVVQPRYRFVPHCPVGGMLTVTNVAEALNKIALNVNGGN